MCVNKFTKAHVMIFAIAFKKSRAVKIENHSVAKFGRGGRAGFVEAKITNELLINPGVSG
jgi:hypothetical protein